MGGSSLGQLFSWSQLNDALAEHRFVPPRLRLEQNGADVTKGLFSTRPHRRGPGLQDLDARVLNERLRHGATLIIDAVNEVSQPLRSLCAALAAEFACACQANLYTCWGTTQGFDVHWDDHDVFVIQLEGQKRWALYGSTHAAASRREPHRQPERPETPCQEILLTPGDILYLPRGYWHAAAGLGQPTMHLTIGLTRKIGADLLHWLADHALMSEIGRSDLPLEKNDVELGAHVSRVLASLLSEAPEELGRLYRRHVEAHQIYRPILAFPYIGETLPDEAVITLAPGAARITPAQDDAAVVLSWRGVEFTLARALEPSLRALLDGAALTVAKVHSAVPETTREDVEELITTLARRGAVLVAPQSPT